MITSEGWRGANLAEDHLLAGLGGDGLQQQLRGRSGVQVRQEAIHTRFAPACQLLAEVDELGDGSEGVLILAAFWSVRAEHVADEGGVTW